MLRRRTLAFIVSLGMLALPATSFAQSAGDDQYHDPLANSGGSTNGHTTDTGGGGGSGNSSGSGSGGGGNTPAAPSTSSGSNVPTSGSTGGGTSQATAAQSNGKQLPRTGFDVVVTFELGFAMLLVGLVAQRMIVLRERRDS